ncbi:MAG: YbhB/YbcL family Raf kinase inhibitor-like protein [Minisyncoccia bacterium]
MNIQSLAFENGKEIPAQYTCDGENTNPALIINDVPKEAKSLALIMDDPDASRGVTWDHWVMWNISPDTTEIKENSVPVGAVQGENSWPKNEYSGPCPPNNSHRYFFKLYVLDTVLDLPKTAGSKELIKAMQNHILAESELMGRYQRK